MGNIPTSSGTKRKGAIFEIKWTREQKIQIGSALKYINHILTIQLTIEQETCYA